MFEVAVAVFAIFLLVRGRLRRGMSRAEMLRRCKGETKPGEPYGPKAERP